jgi:hypothetical protein
MFLILCNVVTFHKTRIDAPGALYHIIIRRIEGRDIFEDSQDYRSFLATGVTRKFNLWLSAVSEWFVWGRQDSFPKGIEKAVFDLK